MFYKLKKLVENRAEDIVTKQLCVQCAETVYYSLTFFTAEFYKIKCLIIVMTGVVLLMWHD